MKTILTVLALLVAAYLLLWVGVIVGFMVYAS